MSGHFSLCGEGLCIGYDGGDAVTSQHRPRFEFSGGRIVKVVFDVADDAYIDVEAHLAAAMAPRLAWRSGRAQEFAGVQQPMEASVWAWYQSLVGKPWSQGSRLATST